jgi:hypothetical protein
MSKSMAVKLVLLNSVLFLPGCSRSSEEEKKEDEAAAVQGGGHQGPGGSHSHRGPGVIFIPGVGWRSGGGAPIGTRPSGGSVGRGGFGGSGVAAS